MLFARDQIDWPVVGAHRRSGAFVGGFIGARVGRRIRRACCAPSSSLIGVVAIVKLVWFS